MARKVSNIKERVTRAFVKYGQQQIPLRAPMMRTLKN